MRFELANHATHIEVHVSGQFSLPVAMRIVDHISEICRQTGLARVLVDGAGLAPDVPMGARFMLAEHLAARVPRGVKLAFLASELLNNQSKLLENTANNRGAMVLATVSRAKALGFLGVTEHSAD
jgi:hypothetical protein